MERNPTAFLTAQWRNLVVVNYEIDSDILAPHVPWGTELDLWQGRALISLVGFEFRDTRVCGYAIPFHRNFEEVNLRFYIRRRVNDGWRRGVCFLRELVPRRAVSWVARSLYGENYATVPMGHAIECASGGAFEASYCWRWSGRECRLVMLRRRRRSRGLARLARRIHHRTLLGLLGRARTRDRGVPGRTSALEVVARSHGMLYWRGRDPLRRIVR